MPQEMSSSEIETFLSNRGHGVLVLNSDSPYGIPISFGIDNDTIVTQLLSTDESKKQRLLDANNNVCLVVYEVNSPFKWKSIVIDGTLEEFDTPPTEQELEIFATDAEVVDLSVFNKDTDQEFDGTWYTLEIDTISAYKSPLKDDGNTR